jgi:hypothetical protein
VGALKILTEKPREALVGLAPDWRLLDVDMLDTVVLAEENMSNVFEKNRSSEGRLYTVTTACECRVRACATSSNLQENMRSIKLESIRRFTRMQSV